MISDEQKSRILELAIKAVDADMTPADFKELEGYISSSKSLAAYYSDCIKIHLSLVECQLSNGSVHKPGKDVFDHGLWQEMAVYEKIAPEVDVEVNSEEEPRVFQKVLKPEKIPHKISKFSIVSVLLNAAAILFILIFIHYVKQPTSPEVATLTDSIDAQWAWEEDVALSTGVRFAADRTFRLLQSGVIELRFDTNARVLIESPAEFQIQDEHRIHLRYGKLYAVVPQEAIGFTVNTDTARIIDLGTEFGVQANIDGDTELHVIRGKTSLIAGDKSTKTSIRVNAGRAKRISAGTMTISDIPCQQQFFVRSIDSMQHFVYRGQKAVDLADIVGGGNGFGAGKFYMGIDPISGKPLGELIGMQKSSNDFRIVPSNPYIDGVFVPDGRTQQVVSSQGHIFRECPATEGACFNMVYCRQQPLGWPETQNVGPLAAPCVMIHANTGITFDLQAIRRLLPKDLNFVRFHSKIGIEKDAPRQEASNADFWVLVDGQLRYQKSQVKAGEFSSVALDLSEKDCFLTLVITDGQDPEDRIVNGGHISPMDSDWGFLAEPRLEIKSK